MSRISCIIFSFVVLAAAACGSRDQTTAPPTVEDQTPEPTAPGYGEPDAGLDSPAPDPAQPTTPEGIPPDDTSPPGGDTTDAGTPPNGASPGMPGQGTPGDTGTPGGQGPGQAEAGDVTPTSEVVFFARDSAKLTDRAKTQLDNEVVWLKENPERHVVVHGYTDEKGTKAYNRRLGKKRAEAVRGYLESQGIERDRIHVVSHGEAKAIDLPDTIERRALFVAEEAPNADNSDDGE